MTVWREEGHEGVERRHPALLFQRFRQQSDGISALCDLTDDRLAAWSWLKRVNIWI